MISPDLYRERATRFATEVQQTEKTIRVYAWTRLALVAVAALMVYFGISLPVLFWSLPVVAAVFIILVRKQVKLENQKTLLTNLCTLNEQEIKALNFEETSFPDGQQFSDPRHPFSYDLDLFGKRSVFKFINRCATGIGENKLASDLLKLSENPLSTPALTERQEAVRELSNKLELRQHAWAIGWQANNLSFNHRIFKEWLSAKPFVLGYRWITLSRYVLPVLTMLAVVWAFSDASKTPFALVLMAIQLGVVNQFAKKIKTTEQQLNHGNKMLSNYAQLLELLSKEKFDSSLMKKHHALATEASQQIKLFSSLINSFEARQNPIAMFFGNGFFQFDLHAISKLEQWRSDNGTKITDWLTSLAEWDSLLAPATLHFNFPEYAFAETSEGNSLDAKGVGHLLIPPTECVANDVELGKPSTVFLITGANMAGKSTFLRSLGVNFVLGNIGSPVCATHWRAPRATLRTGMRTTDSLQDHQSYFFAELNRLQAIMQELRRGKPMFILLDEILKGTNSTDKQLGSRELLKQLKDLNALVVLATHDIALGDLEQQYPQHVANACFEGKIVDNNLTFDYKLNRGIAQKANATFLMRKLGIIPDE